MMMDNTPNSSFFGDAHDTDDDDARPRVVVGMSEEEQRQLVKTLRAQATDGIGAAGVLLPGSDDNSRQSSVFCERSPNLREQQQRKRHSTKSARRPQAQARQGRRLSRKEKQRMSDEWKRIRGRRTRTEACAQLYPGTASSGDDDSGENSDNDAQAWDFRGGAAAVATSTDGSRRASVAGPTSTMSSVTAAMAAAGVAAATHRRRRQRGASTPSPFADRYPHRYPMQHQKSQHNPSMAQPVEPVSPMLPAGGGRRQYGAGSSPSLPDSPAYRHMRVYSSDDMDQMLSILCHSPSIDQIQPPRSEVEEHQRHHRRHHHPHASSRHAQEQEEEQLLQAQQQARRAADHCHHRHVVHNEAGVAIGDDDFSSARSLLLLAHDTSSSSSQRGSGREMAAAGGGGGGGGTAGAGGDQRSCSTSIDADNISMASTFNHSFFGGGLNRAHAASASGGNGGGGGGGGGGDNHTVGNRSAADSTSGETLDTIVLTPPFQRGFRAATRRRRRRRRGAGDVDGGGGNNRRRRGIRVVGGGSASASGSLVALEASSFGLDDYSSGESCNLMCNCVIS